MHENEKRVFFALEVEAPWPQTLPVGRILDESHRHLTLAFLGMADFSRLKELLPHFPAPPFRVGFAGMFDKCLFLPERHPRVTAWHVKWFDDTIALIPFQKALVAWLQLHGFNPDARENFLPHVTLCRAPFDPHQWKKAFVPLPMIVTNIHLYESIGRLKYVPRWTFPLTSPFEEIEHTADIAYRVHGESLDQLQKHALIALSFKFPELIEYFDRLQSPKKVEDIVLNLNHIVAHLDEEKGCPFKAVSYHGEAVETEDGALTWEMIVDV